MSWRDVRSQEQRGKHLLTVSSSQFDPLTDIDAVVLPLGQFSRFARNSISPGGDCLTGSAGTISEQHQR